MAALGPLLRTGTVPDGGRWIGHWCPGCRHAHLFYVDREKRPCWTFDGDAEKPTFSPSMRVFIPADAEFGMAEKTLCHYFLRAGVIEFLGDSSGHALRGFVPLPPFPEGYGID